ncbi:MAG: hypothetical protein JXR90_00825 [Spirochaetes bacterium]|nr:hypothetical protein [Spirochaetota bacterium]
MTKDEIIAKEKTVADYIAMAEFYADELKDEEKAMELYGMATGMSENNAEGLCAAALSILLHLNDRDSASMLYEAGVSAFDDIDDLVVLRDNIKKFHPDPDLLRKVNEKIGEAELKGLPKFRIALKGYDKNEVDAYLKNLGK